MPKPPSRVQEVEATRLLKAARAAGYMNPRLEVEPNGKLVLVAENPAPAAPAVPGAEAPNPWDEAV